MTPVWRSLQYVPAHVEKYVSSPHIAAADAVILDLEDSVPADSKALARAALAKAAPTVAHSGADVLVRINDGDMAAEDIAAAVRPGVSALVIPKVRDAAGLKHLDRLVADAETAAGMASGSVRFVVLIETADGFLDMPAIARATGRTVAMSLGNEDFALDLGMEASDETLLMPRQQLVIVAAAAGLMPLGLVGSATRFDDPDAYRALALKSRRFGYVGSSCIHPSQIALLNEAFSPTAEQVVEARRLVQAAEAAGADGRGAFSIDGRMIDGPIVARARALLRKHQAIETRRSRGEGS
ncbi:MAG: CoA ester lyase [Brevundimonas sp.]|uniref:HpcH/HpaI aldolase/citrate lyase family protein n=1 Tax=Brevundimonas sp. TaxID=1871086 RepID=UPI002724BBAA|nr:CoA ester lyase [Brevundimonas sp.]MDO9077773.1 CoA ester lyase [Brevundimonas sp.]MDP3081725.1 CoA ester lyase [Brevundimonas sp.]MDZ4062526.1 CoA ester lyase [Brevundimonas sp.]